jgi:hypothetical protein
VLLASGLRVGESTDFLPLQMLVDYVGGHLGGAVDRRDVSARIARVVLAGNLVTPSEAAALKEKHLSQKQQAELAMPMRTLDLMLAQVGRRTLLPPAPSIALRRLAWGD